MEGADRTSAVERCITLATKALLDERRNAGYWDGASSCPYATACALAAMVELDERFDPAMREKAVAYLIATQRQNGSWSLGVVSGEQLPITAHCYAALSMYHARFEKTSNRILIEAIRRARAYLDRALNFLQTFDVNVRHYLASIVVAHWLAETYNIPLLPPALEDRINKIYADHEIWITKSPESCLYRTTAEIVNLARRPDVFRLRELQTRQLENGSWRLQVDLTSLALITVARQHGSDGILHRGCNYLHSLQNTDGGFSEFAPGELCNTIYVGFYFSAVCWRTGTTLPNWLRNMQGWLHQSQNPDGSWSISRWSPGDGDIDDTAWATYWLIKGLNEDPDTPQLRAARAFLEHAQNDDGGFPTWPGQSSAVDLTAHAYQGLRALDSNESILQKAAEYLRLRQFEDGSWSATWNVSKIYGTTQVLMALADDYPSEPFFQSGVNYLLQSQGTDDGLWDTAEETGMALYVLLLLDSCKYQATIERGMEALVDTQDGGYWPEKHKWTAIFSYTTRPWGLAPPIAACLAYYGKVLNGTNLNRLLDVS